MWTDDTYEAVSSRWARDIDRRQQQQAVESRRQLALSVSRQSAESSFVNMLIIVMMGNKQACADVLLRFSQRIRRMHSTKRMTAIRVVLITHAVRELYISRRARRRSRLGTWRFEGPRGPNDFFGDHPTRAHLKSIVGIRDVESPRHFAPSFGLLTIYRNPA